MPHYRSRFEENFNRTHELPYETHAFVYVKKHTYTPDFQLNESTYLELKGLFSAADRKKMVLCIEQNPGLKLILIFQNSKLKLSKSSKTSYGDWATKNNFEWYDCKNALEIDAMIKREIKH